MLSLKALQVLEAFFSENSNIQVPIGVITEAIEIRNWIKEEIKKIKEEQK